ncbi:MAG: dTMP kinase [Desulfocapsa sp.]|nr:MAG: dTMP kinase [Desulfocapsa sp.]
MTLEKGLLIVFEGTDGTGKSTQLKLLARHLEAKGVDILCSFEPTKGIYGQKIRALYSNRGATSREDELELFLADRKEHVANLITPALAAGKVVLLDRYYLSTIAYQGAAGINPAEILAKNRFAPKPDLALLFHVPIETGVNRITESRGDTLNDFENEDYLLKVKKQFEMMDLPCIRRVDANRSIEAIHLDVCHLVSTLPGME